MNNDVRVSGSVSTILSSSQKVHDLTILYLKNQDLTNITTDDLAKKYIDTVNSLNTSLNDYRKSLKEF